MEEEATSAPTAATSILSAPAVVVGEKQKRRRRAPGEIRKKPPDMPRRPLSAYNIFFREERARLLKERGREQERRGLEGTGRTDAAGCSSTVPSKGLFATMGKTIAKRWKEIPPEYLEALKKQAAEEAKRYSHEIQVYRRRKKEDAEAEQKQKKIKNSGSQTNSKDLNSNAEEASETQIDLNDAQRSKESLEQEFAGTTESSEEHSQTKQSRARLSSLHNASPCGDRTEQQRQSAHRPDQPIDPSIGLLTQNTSSAAVEYTTSNDFTQSAMYRIQQDQQRRDQIQHDMRIAALLRQEELQRLSSQPLLNPQLHGLFPLNTSLPWAYGLPVQGTGAFPPLLSSLMFNSTVVPQVAQLRHQALLMRDAQPMYPVLSQQQQHHHQQLLAEEPMVNPLIESLLRERRQDHQHQEVTTAQQQQQQQQHD